MAVRRPQPATTNITQASKRAHRAPLQLHGIELKLRDESAKTSGQTNFNFRTNQLKLEDKPTYTSGQTDLNFRTNELKLQDKPT